MYVWWRLVAPTGAHAWDWLLLALGSPGGRGRVTSPRYPTGTLAPFIEPLVSRRRRSRKSDPNMAWFNANASKGWYGFADRSALIELGFEFCAYSLLNTREGLRNIDGGN
jgi:hypothetical protein